MIENKLVSGILNEFKHSLSLTKEEESKVFEYLVNYLIVSKIHPEAFGDIQNLFNIDVDSGGNFGIDGIAIIVNNNLLISKDEIETYRKSKNLEVQFIFTQSKASSKLDVGDLYKLIGAVKNFFADEPEIALSENAKFYRELKEELFSHTNARHFNKKTSPSCTLCFATTGKEINDSTVQAIINQEINTIKNAVPELKDVRINLIHADNIIDMYNEHENRFEVIVNFKNNLSLDKIVDVKQSYIGYLSANEFLKMINDEDSNLRRNLFYENVRDFQGEDNKVNIEISETFTEEDLQDKFILLNNGVTIVAKYLNYLGSNDYEIKDFQIVNGCQTSTILHLNKDKIKDKDNFWIPVKIIHTHSGEVINRIIRATNRQSTVPEEAFIALEKFHKRLQEYYVRMSQEMPERIYYERRFREYVNSDLDIEKVRVINLHNQIRSFTSIFLIEPQYVYTNNPNHILKSRSQSMFIEDHHYISYYTSSYIMYTLQKWIAERKLNKKYTIFKYYIGLILRVIHNKSISPGHINSKEIEKNCRALLNDLKCETKTASLINDSICILEKALKKHNQEKKLTNRSVVEYSAFKDEVISQLRGHLEILKLKNNGKKD